MCSDLYVVLPKYESNMDLWFFAYGENLHFVFGSDYEKHFPTKCFRKFVGHSINLK